jgi:ABC-type lipoprotein release transport system permease subunit
MPVRGILKFPSPKLNSFGAYISLTKAGDFFGAQGMITSMAMLVQNYREVNRITGKLRNDLGSKYSVKTWNEMQPDLLKMIEGDKAGAIIMKGILYIVVGFGILGTVIMMMAERKREMGVLIAVGMQKTRLQRILCYESMCIGLLGVCIGFLISMPFIMLMVYHPITLGGEMARAYEAFGIEAVMYFALIPGIFINQAITILMISLGIAIYPWLVIKKMIIIRALHG